MKKYLFGALLALALVVAPFVSSAATTPVANQGKPVVKLATGSVSLKDGRVEAVFNGYVSSSGGEAYIDKNNPFNVRLINYSGKGLNNNSCKVVSYDYDKNLSSVKGKWGQLITVLKNGTNARYRVVVSCDTNGLLAGVYYAELSYLYYWPTIMSQYGAHLNINNKSNDYVYVSGDKSSPWISNVNNPVENGGKVALSGFNLGNINAVYVDGLPVSTEHNTSDPNNLSFNLAEDLTVGHHEFQVANVNGRSNLGDLIIKPRVIIVSLLFAPSTFIPTSQTLKGGDSKSIIAIDLSVYRSKLAVSRLDVHFTERPWLNFSEVSLRDINGTIIARKTLSGPNDATEVSAGSEYFVRFDNIDYPVIPGNKSTLVAWANVRPIAKFTAGEKVGVSIPAGSVQYFSGLSTTTVGLGSAFRIGGAYVNTLTMLDTVSSPVITPTPAPVTPVTTGSVVTPTPVSTPAPTTVTAEVSPRVSAIAGNLYPGGWVKLSGARLTTDVKIVDNYDPSKIVVPLSLSDVNGDGTRIDFKLPSDMKIGAYYLNVYSKTGMKSPTMPFPVTAKPVTSAQAKVNQLAATASALQAILDKMMGQ